MRNGPARNVAPYRVGQRLEPRVGPIALPVFKRQRLDLAETERRLNSVEADRDIRIAFLRSPRLVADEMSVMADRSLGPSDDHAFGSLEMLLDILVPVGAATDAGVPPDAEAFCFQCLDERDKARAILRLVRQEHVRCWTCHCAPSANVSPRTL
jgi:hypothetical protein